MTTPDAIVSIRGLRISSRVDGREQLLVDGLDLDVQQGQAIAIVGESGSGKSLTTRAMTGLLAPGLVAQGSIRIDGKEFIGANEPQWRSVRGRRIALLPQDPFTMLSPLRSVADQIRDGARGPVSEDDLAARLREVGIEDAAVAKRFPFQLSGGLRQRVGIAAALASDPDVLLADEPSTALDVTTQRRVLSLLRRLQRERGLALVIITHDLRVAFSVTSRIVVLYAGSVLETGATQSVEESPTHPYTRRLIECEPTVDHRMSDLVGIPGSVPRAQEIVGQCAFASRCELADDECRSTRPVLTEVADQHSVACLKRAQILRHHFESRVASEPERSGEATEVLRLIDIKRTFAGRRGSAPVKALRGVSITVRAGESVGIVGESGSGKSTLSRIIAGLEVADSGTIDFPGQPPRDPRRPSPVQVVFQDPSSTLNPARKVGAMLSDALARAGKPSGKADVSRLLDEVSLPHAYAERKPAALSGGERQRVAIARAIAPGPRILLCDEPVSALDVSVQALVLSLLRDLQQRMGISLVFITHDLAVVRQIADRLYVLRQGLVVESGPTVSVLSEASDPYTRELIASVPRAGDDWLSA